MISPPTRWSLCTCSAAGMLPPPSTAEGANRSTEPEAPPTGSPVASSAIGTFADVLPLVLSGPSQDGLGAVHGTGPLAVDAEAAAGADGRGAAANPWRWIWCVRKRVVTGTGSRTWEASIWPHPK